MSAGFVAVSWVFVAIGLLVALVVIGGAVLLAVLVFGRKRNSEDGEPPGRTEG